MGNVNIMFCRNNWNGNLGTNRLCFRKMGEKERIRYEREREIGKALKLAIEFNQDFIIAYKENTRKRSRK